MNQFDSSKDYYSLLGADDDISQGDIERLYKRLATKRHPDRGGDEEEMKTLNEAYRVLGNSATRDAYDAARREQHTADPLPQTSPAAKITVFTSQWVGAILFLGSGLTLALLVRFQWIWFLWPLAILSAFLVIFGIVLAHAAMQALGDMRTPARKWFGVTLELLFWAGVAGGGVGVYLVLR